MNEMLKIGPVGSPPRMTALVGSGGSKRVTLSSPIMSAVRLSFSELSPSSPPTKIGSIDSIEFVTPVNNNRRDDHHLPRPRPSRLSLNTPCARTSSSAARLTPDFTALDDNTVQRKTPQQIRVQPMHTISPPPRRRAVFWPRAGAESLFKEMQIDVKERGYGEATVDDFFDLQAVGHGSFYQVWRARSRADASRRYALKQSRKPFRGWNDRAMYMKEIHALNRIPPHPHVVEYYRAWQEKGHLFILMGLCECSLSALPYDTCDDDHYRPFDEGFVIDCIGQIAQGLAHIHEQDVAHLDIKPDNILVTSMGQLKVADFGQAHIFSECGHVDLDMNEGDCRYIAPELLVCGSISQELAMAADMFSLGLLALELYAQLELPTGGPAWHSLRDGRGAAEYLRSCDERLSSLIMSLLSMDAMARPTAKEVASRTLEVATKWSYPNIQELFERRRENDASGGDDESIAVGA